MPGVWCQTQALAPAGCVTWDKPSPSLSFLTYKMQVIMALPFGELYVKAGHIVGACRLGSKLVSVGSAKGGVALGGFSGRRRDTPGLRLRLISGTFLRALL